jgi:hypothetical protein
MTERLIRAIVFLLAAQTFILVSGFLMYAMIGEVNRKLPDGQRIGYLFGHYGKYRRLFREYRRLYPNGRLGLYCKITGALGMASMAAFAWQLGFFR